MITKLIDSVKSGSTEVIKVMIERGEVTPRTRLPVRLISRSLVISRNLILSVQMKLYVIPGK